MDTKQIKEIFKEKGVNPSLQRIEIFNYVLKNKTHPSVDEIYEKLNEKIPTLSKTTIYNTLKLFSKKKLISEILIEEKEVRFDYIEKPHIHFKCRNCKKIYDIYKKCPIVNCKKIDGHKVEEYHIYLIGICKNCKEEK